MQTSNGFCHTARSIVVKALFLLFAYFSSVSSLYAYTLLPTEHYVGTIPIVAQSYWLQTSSYNLPLKRNRDLDTLCADLAPKTIDYMYGAPGYILLSATYTGYEAIQGPTKSNSSAC